MACHCSTSAKASIYITLYSSNPRDFHDDTTFMCMPFDKTRIWWFCRFDFFSVVFSMDNSLVLVWICRRTLIFIILVLLACCVYYRCCWFFSGVDFIHCCYHSKRLWCLYATVTSNEANENGVWRRRRRRGEEESFDYWFVLFFLHFIPFNLCILTLTEFCYFSQCAVEYIGHVSSAFKMFIRCCLFYEFLNKHFDFRLILSHWIITKFACVFELLKAAAAAPDYDDVNVDVVVAVTAAAYLIPLIEILFIFVNDASNIHQKWLVLSI